MSASPSPDGDARVEAIEVRELAAHLLSPGRVGYLAFVREVERRFDLLGTAQQRRVHPERVEGEVTVGGAVIDAMRERAPHLIGGIYPQVNADVRDVVTAGARLDLADLDEVRRAFEGSLQPRQGVAVPEIGRCEVLGSLVIEILLGREECEILDRLGGPAGHVARELLDDGKRALAAAVTEGVGDLGARA